MKMLSNQAKELVKALCQTRFYGMMVRQERFSKTFLVLTVKASLDPPVLAFAYQGRHVQKNITQTQFRTNY